MRSTSTPVDTDDEVFRHQVERWRSMTPLERAQLADRLSVDVTTIAVAGIQYDQPEASADDVGRELARRRFGAAISSATAATYHR